MTSFSVYPTFLDGYSTLPLVKDGISEIRAQDHNSLRSAIINIEQELGIEPSGAYSTVRSRLDSVGDASALIESHIANPTDAHDASAISIVDANDNYVSGEVEGALSELAAVLPASIDVVGEDKSAVPNSGIPNFVSNDGILHVFNTSGGSTILSKTQPVAITGVHIIEIGSANGTGTGRLNLSNHSPATVEWEAPGDSFGASVDISSLSEGDIVTLSSNDTDKKIRIARNGVAFPGTSPATESFDILKFNAKSGLYSIDGTGQQASAKITRAATSDTNTSREQFMIGGMISPADKGILVLQRKLRATGSSFAPIAALDLKDNFDEDLRLSGQPVYTPALTSYDTVTLYDRLPARGDYETLSTNSDGDYLYENFDLTTPFISFQLARYLIPISNDEIVSGTLESPTDSSASEIDNKVSAYRIVHYKDGVTDFTGEPTTADIFSISDALAGADDGDNNVRMSNVYLDTNTTRPTIAQLVLRPVASTENTTKIISGIHYYNGSSDTFDVEMRANTDTFNKTYVTDILRFGSDAFDFPGEADGYGDSVELRRLLDDGYEAFSDSNLPAFSDQAFYFANSALNTSNRIIPASDRFSNRSFITAALSDPFGPGDAFDSYGVLSGGVDAQILVNSFGLTRATDTKEFFTDESRRVGNAEFFEFALDVDQFTFEDGAGTYGTLDDWDNTAALSFGELQVGGIFSAGYANLPGLVHPQSDYTSSELRPTQQGGTDYSAAGYEVESIYQRVFTLGQTTNGGKLRIISSGNSLISFDDISADNATRPVRIEVKIPGSGNNSTGFMDIGLLFQNNKTSEADGALSGKVTGGDGDFTVPFTFGNKNTFDSGNMIAVRVTFAPDDGGGNVADAKTKILSSIELLRP